MFYAVTSLWLIQLLIIYKPSLYFGLLRIVSKMTTVLPPKPPEVSQSPQSPTRPHKAPQGPTRPHKAPQAPQGVTRPHKGPLGPARLHKAPQGHARPHKATRTLEFMFTRLSYLHNPSFLSSMISWCQCHETFFLRRR